MVASEVGEVMDHGRPRVWADRDRERANFVGRGKDERDPVVGFPEKVVLDDVG